MKHDQTTNPEIQQGGCQASPSLDCSPRSDSAVGKSYTMIGFGGPRLAARVKSEGLVLWSVSQAKGYPDEFTHGWSGCDPGHLYFVENEKGMARRPDDGGQTDNSKQDPNHE